MVVAIIACMVVQTQANSMAIICFPAHPTAERVSFQVVHLWRLSAYNATYICNYIVPGHGSNYILNITKNHVSLIVGFDIPK